ARSQGLTRDQLHDQDEAASERDDVVQRDDPGVGEFRDGAAFLEDALAGVRARGDVRTETLQSDLAAEPRVAGAKHGRKAALADRLEDFEVADAFHGVRISVLASLASVTNAVKARTVLDRVRMLR